MLIHAVIFQVSLASYALFSCFLLHFKNVFISPDEMVVVIPTREVFVILGYLGDVED